MKHWDSTARRYVEGHHDVTHGEDIELAMTTFGPLLWYGPDGEATNDNRPTACAEGRKMTRAEFDAAPVEAWDRGPWVLTYTGMHFHPFDPRPEDIRIEDIAHGLANSARYNGAGKRYYSTAEHSVHIARWLVSKGMVRCALYGLLHDAPEPLSGFGDVLRPVKDRAPIIKETEANIWCRAIAPAFGLQKEMLPSVHEADSRIIADEMQQNMHEVDPGYDNPLGVRLEFWPPEVAELHFLDMFAKLSGKGNRWAA